MTSSAVPPPEIGAAGFEAGRTLHFPCFDAFRFFGMTMVLVVHSTFATRPWVQEHLPSWMEAIFERMDVGVAVFFMISGFLLFRPFVARQIAGRAQGSTKTFFRRRILRVIPGYWFALTACVVLFGQLLGGAKNAFLYYSLLFPFASYDVALAGGPGQRGDYAIPQAWSLTAEFVFYLMLPVLAIVLARLARGRAAQLQVRHALLVCAGLYVVGQLFRFYFCAFEPSWTPVATIWAPNWVDFFGIGMAMATFSAWEHAGGHLPRFLWFLGEHPLVSWLAACVVALSFVTFRAPQTPGEVGAEYFVRWFLFGIFAFFLLAPAMFGDQTRGRARRFLASRPLVFLGTISLGFYLFHKALITQTQDWLGVGAFGGTLPEVFGITFVASIAMAAISYYLVERPFLRLKDTPLTSLVRR